ncbi:hypothetical protein VTN00DRAFT_756 [Thermoascus crustaceus]|uniref:uncharacterized protein n=1 Tax=Thermoascus crustaceus TaxID=5088 RepID=UPI003744A117
MRPVSVGILSIGDMGLGIAKLLQAHDYRVLTVCLGRSEDTLARIHSASMEALPSDQDLVIQSDFTSYLSSPLGMHWPQPVA